MIRSLQLIDEWRAAAEFTPEKVLNRLSEEANAEGFDHYGTRDQSRLIKERFEAFAITIDGRLQITQPAFVRLLQDAGELPTSDTGVEAGHVMFDSLCYLSRYPFPSAHDTPMPEALAWDEFCRGLAWLLSIEAKFLPHGAIGDATTESVQSRFRTTSDYRRVLFQSLAISRNGKDLPYDVEEARRLSWRDAQETGEHDGFFVRENNDEHGDEVFHDLLQVLFCTQPGIRTRVGLSDASRESILPLAHELHDRQNLPLLHQLSIPPGRFKKLVKVLLLCQFDPKNRSEAELAGKFPDKELDGAAESIVNAFCHLPQVGITWQMFNETLRKLVTPAHNQAYLLDPILRIFPRSLFDQVLCDYDPESPVPDCGPKNILNPAVMAQLHTVLLSTVDFASLHCVHRHAPSAPSVSASSFPPNAKALVESFKHSSEDSIILAISGTSSSTDQNSGSNATVRHTFAVALGCLGEDDLTIQASGDDRVEKTLMLQISPVHDIFRSVVGKPAWTFDGDNVWFGSKGKGVSMMVQHDLKRCIFTHVVTNGNDHTYESTKWRGDWSVELEIEQIEVWQDTES